MSAFAGDVVQETHACAVEERHSGEVDDDGPGSGDERGNPRPEGGCDSGVDVTFAVQDDGAVVVARSGVECDGWWLPAGYVAESGQVERIEDLGDVLRLPSQRSVTGGSTR